MPSACDSGHALATLDSSTDRVRLTFDRTDSCARITEVTWIADTETELASPARWTLAALTTVVVGIPLLGGVLVASQKGNSKITEALGPAAIAITLGAGVAAFVGSGVAIGVPSKTTQTLQLVRDPVLTSQQVVVEGSLTIEGGPPHRVVNGAIALTLHEALGLSDGQMRLDGATVELIGLDSGLRLRALPACQFAIAGFEANDATSMGVMQKQSRLAAVEKCREGDWAFADYVASALAAEASPWWP